MKQLYVYGSQMEHKIGKAFWGRALNPNLILGQKNSNWADWNLQLFEENLCCKPTFWDKFELKTYRGRQGQKSSQAHELVALTSLAPLCMYKTYTQTWAFQFFYSIFEFCIVWVFAETIFQAIWGPSIHSRYVGMYSYLLNLFDKTHMGPNFELGYSRRFRKFSNIYLEVVIGRFM